MPLPGEHSCRLHPPSRYARFRRSTRRSAGKVYSIIFGIKADGKSEEQAYRYNKNTWTAAQARRHCKAHDGSFEPARANNMERITANIDGQVRTQVFDGRTHLVMPVVLIVEGVHTGRSGMPTYYSPEELMASVHLWNGVAVPVFHPQNEQGESISANQPDVIEECVVGRLFNVHFDENGNKLRGEIYLDSEKTRRISAALLDAIRGNENIEVSTGLYFDDNSDSGDWNGEHYEVRAINIHPDHLALLPGQIGACSWEDGCGIRANKKTKGDMRVKVKTRPKIDPVMVAEDGGTAGFMDKLKVFAKQVAALCGYEVQEASHDDIRQQIQAQLDAMDTQGWMHYVRDIYDDYCVYEARYQGNNPSEIVSTGVQKFYRRDYSIGNDEKITLADEAQEVKETREWVPVTNQAETSISTHKEESNMDKKKVIDGLIANEKNKFCEDDRKWLDGLEEKQLDKIAPCTNEEPPPEKPPEKAPEQPPEKKPEDTPKPEPKPEDNQQPVTVDEYVAKAPPEVGSFLKRAVAAENEKKAVLVKELVANKRCKFTEEQLKAKDVTELEQLAELANVEVDFTGRVGAPASAEPEGMPMPPVFEKVK